MQLFDIYNQSGNTFFMVAICDHKESAFKVTICDLKSLALKII